MKNVIILALILTASGSAYAQVASGGSYTIVQSVIASGGGVSSDASGTAYRLEGTIGQPIAGQTSTNSPFTLKSGFFTAEAFDPTAAMVSISGRVEVSGGGVIRYLYNAKVNLADVNGNVRIVITNQMGYFQFDEVAAGEVYVITVLSKNHQFDAQVVNVNGELTDVNFIAP
jgi:hypothetical protein